jgi:serine/threonine protein kinase
VAGESGGRSDWMLAGFGPGSLVAGYRLEARIGAGGMAVVFRARDEALGRTVALKVLAPALAGDDEFRERFVRESRAAAAVDHPHIIPVYSAGEADRVLYLAMRFVSGGDLRSAAHREGPLPGQRAASLLSPVASALDAAHAAGLVHRDVKPANILVDASPGRPDHPYLSDFGLAKGTASAAGLTGTGQFLGTPDFAAPEQISSKPVTARADQYALACVAFTILTGSLPFAREESMAVLWAHMYDAPPLVTALRPDLPAAVNGVLARALAKSPADRYPTCGQFADALAAALRVGGYASSGEAYPDARLPSARGIGIPRDETAPAIRLPPSIASSPANRAFQPTAPPWDRADEAILRSSSNHQLTQPAAMRPDAAPGQPAPSHHGRHQSARRRRRRAGIAAATVIIVAAGGATAAILATEDPGPAAATHADTTASPATGDRAYSVKLAATMTEPGPYDQSAATFTPDGTLITADDEGNAYVWNVATRAAKRTVSGSAASQFFALSPDGSTLAVVVSGRDIDSRSTVSSETTGSEFNWRNVYGGAIPGDLILERGQAALSYTGVLALPAPAGAARRGVYVWDTVTGTETTRLIPPDNGVVTSVAVSPDGDAVAGGQTNGVTYVWDEIQSGDNSPAFTLHNDSLVYLSAFSADDKRLITVDWHGRAQVWDCTTGRLIATLSGMTSSLTNAVALSPDGALVAAGDVKGVSVWNVSTDTLIATLPNPGSGVEATFAFSPDGKELAVADSNGNTAFVNIWKISG